jgi:hypothetical protein
MTCIKEWRHAADHVSYSSNNLGEVRLRNSGNLYYVKIIIINYYIFLCMNNGT